MWRRNRKTVFVLFMLPGIGKDFAVAPSQPLRAAAPRNRSPPGGQFGSKQFKRMRKSDAQSASSSGGYGNEADPSERSQLSGILSDVLRTCESWLDDLSIPSAFCISVLNQFVSHVPGPQLPAIGRRPKWRKNTTSNRKRIIMQPFLWGQSSSLWSQNGEHNPPSWDATKQGPPGSEAQWSPTRVCL